MAVCTACGADRSRDELVDEVFRVDERYVLVGGIPARVCVRCGAQSFSRETTERVRRMLHGHAEPTRSIPLGIFEFNRYGAAVKDAAG
jgi:YgiT-type zinc finger domain-containing protein